VTQDAIATASEVEGRPYPIRAELWDVIYDPATDSVEVQSRTDYIDDYYEELQREKQQRLNRERNRRHQIRLAAFEAWVSPPRAVAGSH
jgi:hypothetical protein